MEDQKKFKLSTVAKNLVLKGKGILAADESPISIEKRFKENNIKNTTENRKIFRENIIKNVNSKISGVILHEETFDIKNEDGKYLTEILKEKDIYVGIKLDKGLTDFNENEKISIGLEDLEMRIQRENFKIASFAKWRSVFMISKNTPSSEAIIENCRVLAKYAKIAQKYDLVPIVEPEILWDGEYTIQECSIKAKEIFNTLISELNKNDVYLPAVLIKTSFITHSPNHNIFPKDVGKYTVETLISTIPCAIPGILFLSGGHSPSDSILYLNETTKNSNSHSWHLTFSFGRAITDPFLKRWRGNEDNLDKAGQSLREGIDLCSKATLGLRE